jgi:hypothetical protein
MPIYQQIGRALLSFHVLNLCSSSVIFGFLFDAHNAPPIWLLAIICHMIRLDLLTTYDYL